MAGTLELQALEKKIGKEAATKLKAAFKTTLNQSLKITGESKKATVTAKYKQGRLDRLTFSAPRYIFIQNYGFEGTKKNGVYQRLKATDVLNKALDKSNVLDTLADSLADLRGEAVVTAINFIQPQNGR